MSTFNYFFLISHCQNSFKVHPSVLFTAAETQTTVTASFKALQPKPWTNSNISRLLSSLKINNQSFLSLSHNAQVCYSKRLNREVNFTEQRANFVVGYSLDHSLALPENTKPLSNSQQVLSKLTMDISTYWMTNFPKGKQMSFSGSGL